MGDAIVIASNRAHFLSKAQALLQFEAPAILIYSPVILGSFGNVPQGVFSGVTLFLIRCNVMACFVYLFVCLSSCVYGVVPKGLLTFLGSLYKEVAKTAPGTLVHRFERQTARKKVSQNTVSST